MIPLYAKLLEEISSAKNEDQGKFQDTFRELLDEIIQRNPYQVLGRLFALKARLDDLSLELSKDHSAMSDEDKLMKAKELETLAGELEKTAEFYDGPLHFTPFHLGVSQALVGLALLAVNSNNHGKRFLHCARKTLSASLGMFTTKEEYYRSIGKLFYLYDDFNDRRIHFNHAIQMAGAELSHWLLEIIDRELAPKT